ncbi:MAG TPA: chromate resistance protein ChrB domain-containing protein [Lacunisphaera sp.]|jgi:hypothetical protein|nr:chromate resistance protein ChrB domain-containing protein [Lacunisphaera sp.]
MKTTRWLLLLYALPAGHGSLRVGLWRNLRKLGALPLKTSAYLLPDRPAQHESFQWLAQQLRDGGGEATLIRTEEIEGLTAAEIKALFNQARAADYAALNRELTALLRRHQRKPAAGQAAPAEKLRARFAEIQKIDFFDAPAKHDTLVLWRKLDRLSGPAHAPAPRVRRADYQGRTWLTRPRPEVDRVASAWLIKTFIDPRAKFVFAAKPGAGPAAIPYDMLEGEFTHQGDDCTFETLLKRFGLADRTLQRLAEMVHHADLEDGKFPAAEAEGLHQVFRGLARLGWSDERILAHGFTCFDALYAAVKAS